MESCWYSFKDKTGLPFLFYNSETLEHRWTSGYEHTKCSKAALDEIPSTHQCSGPEMPRKKIKTYRSIATETDTSFLPVMPSKKLYKDAMTSTDDIFLGESYNRNSAIINVEKGAEPSLDVAQEAFDVNINQSELVPQRIASPPRNPFSVDQTTVETLDQDYGQSKESLVRNLFAMEVSSILSDDDTAPIPGMSKLDTYSKTEVSYVERSGESQFQTERIENENEKEQINMCGKDFENATPLLMDIKVEPDLDEVGISCESNIKLEQTDDNMGTAGCFSIADLLPSQTKGRTKDLRKYKCPVCSASFKRSTDLQRHMFVHSDIISMKPKPHACTLCDKRFVEANCLKKHLRTHTGEKPYHCPVCGKAFSQSQNLNKHKNIHTGYRPHKCKDCGKDFVQHSHLARHKLIHTGEKPFPCGQCPKTYRTRSHLIRHFKSSNHREMTSPKQP